MDINLKVRLESPELYAALLALAEALPLGSLRGDIPLKVEEVKEKETKIEITLEDVRELLAKKAQEGKQVKVKELIKSFGGTKLTDVAKENYGQLIKAAEEI
ncbi:hypothetical protein SH2C18_45680 [Clostridium sediminicola]|uniref:rRNA biogenesis protein rrp5 n=1 Tax=Clostridium sediminicola TaxID=3114879 RepID=UPI0031F270F1